MLGVCRLAVWQRSAARCDEVFYCVTGWDRSRQIEQAERRDTREIPALRLSRPGRGAVSVAHRGARRESRAAGDGNVNGRNAHLLVGESHPDVKEGHMPLTSLPTT